jgi:predicted PurR-regulated permease PerM
MERTIDQTEQARQPGESAPRWSDFTKRTVSLVFLLLLALMVYRFRNILFPLVVAFLLAFILNPVVDFLTDRVRLSRGIVTGLVFLILIVVLLAVVAAPVTAVPSIGEAVRNAQFDFVNLVNDVGAFFETPIQVGNHSLDLSDVYQELRSMLTSFAGSVAEGTLTIAVNIASGAFWLIVILITAFYLVKDIDRLAAQLDKLAPPGYQRDFARLRQQISGVWNAFLRGQLVMGLIMVAITTVACTAIGLPYAWVMGLIAGLTEFIPNVGPIIALVPAVLVALFRGSTFLPLGNLWFAVLVVGIYAVIQQIEGNLILPRVLGDSLDLHPLVVIIGIIVGGNVAGVLGMLLAAPILATLREIGNYVLGRLYDYDPFAEAEEAEAEAEASHSNWVAEVCESVWRRMKRGPSGMSKE